MSIKNILKKILPKEIRDKIRPYREAICRPIHFVLWPYDFLKTYNGLKNDKLTIRYLNVDEYSSILNRISPNIIWNRFDLKYSDNVSVLEVAEKHYIPIHVKDGIIYTGLYMSEIPNEVFQLVVLYIQFRFPKSKCINILQSVNSHRELFQGMHWLLQLPESFEEYESRFSKKTLYNRRREKKLLTKENDVEFRYYHNHVPTNIIEQFFVLKEEQKDIYYDLNQSIDDWMKERNVTDVFVILKQERLIAIALFSKACEKIAYCENVAYDVSFSKYSPGIMVLFESFKELISQKTELVYFGGGRTGIRKILR